MRTKITKWKIEAKVIWTRRRERWKKLIFFDWKNMLQSRYAVPIVFDEGREVLLTFYVKKYIIKKSQWPKRKSHWIKKIKKKKKEKIQILSLKNVPSLLFVNFFPSFLLKWAKAKDQIIKPLFHSSLTSMRHQTNKQTNLEIQFGFSLFYFMWKSDD